MHQQSNRQLQDCVSALSIPEVLESAKRFFARRGGVYAAFLEREGPAHVVLRGQGGEEIVIGAYAAPGGSAVSGSSYLFDQQVAQFLASLPPALPVTPPMAEQGSAAAAVAPSVGSSASP